MNRTLKVLLSLSIAFFGLSFGLSQDASAFCGFYVAKADTDLFNEASKVVLVRDGDRTVITMASDFKGDPKEFAIVVPVPTILEREQIHVANPAIITHLDSYSAPRLVEYYDSNPCDVKKYMAMDLTVNEAGSAPRGSGPARAKSLGVTIEAEYKVGEYDIVILSAKQSDGLETWLTESGYRIPSGASSVLGSYLKQGMKFFVAKVNLKEHSKLGFSYLRPIQVAFESPKFMLPIRLGMVNANGPQELFVFALTKDGRVETTNYPTVKLPEGMDIPEYVKNEFPDFYKAMFSTQVEKENGKAVFVEYAWDMGWCDPCAAEPLSNGELKELGVFWIDQPSFEQPRYGTSFRAPQPQNVFLTRLHVRYDNDHFPEDLIFHQTSDRTNFQARYVMRHPWTGSDECAEADSYRSELKLRREREASTLANLTGWEVGAIREKMNLKGESPSDTTKWWKRLWN